MDTFTIFSTVSNEKYTFSNRDGEFFTFEVSGSDVGAKGKVSTYTDEFGIAKLFSGVNELGRPWEGCKEWKSLEGEFTIKLTCNSLGHINMQVNFTQWNGGSEDWHIIVNLTTELGQLALIEKEARAFFSA